MIPKSGYRFSEKIMLKLKINAGSEFSEADIRAQYGAD
jgi:hypothetical protein